MMTWATFIYFAIPAVALSLGAAVVSLCANDHWAASSLVYRRRRFAALALSFASLTALGAFIVGLWISLGRPPMRTMGETRLWYSFFALLSGLLTYLLWRYRWILSFSTVLATVFIVLNIARPEIHDQTLMPALQSAWFIPHVTVYMFSYSLLGCAFIMAVVGLFSKSQDMLPAADTLIYIGVAFLTFGMLSGWRLAKQAWGHDLGWGPEETRALVTWLVYVFYIHLRVTGRGSRRMLYILLIFGFACLQMCWWGINYLPSAADSIHIYNR